MLPMPLYFSDEFKLLSAGQLLKGVQQAALVDTAALTEALQSLELLTVGDLTSILSAAPLEDAALPAFVSPARGTQVLTLEQANYRFNLYLKAIAALAQTAGPASRNISVDPFDLQPACSPRVSRAVLDILVRKLLALVQIAQEHGLGLQLVQPDEAQLESWLYLTEQLLQQLGNTPREPAVALCLSAASKRLLPTLGYLERMAEQHDGRLAITLLEHPVRIRENWPLATTTPTLEDTRSRCLNFMAACSFLASSNNTRLQPSLAVASTGLVRLLSHTPPVTAWPLSQLDTPSQPETTNTATAIPEGPCLLPGLTQVDELLQAQVTQLNLQPLHARPILRGLAAPLEEVETCYQPAAIATPVGSRTHATEEQVREAFASCCEAQSAWAKRPLDERKAVIARLAQALLSQQAELALLYATETGVPLQDCLREVSHAYQLLHRHLDHSAQVMQAEQVQGSSSTVWLQPGARGTWLGILPGQQPLLHFASHVSATLLTGNALLLKPADPAVLILTRLFELLLQAGVPGDLVALLPGSLERLGAHLYDDYRLEGVLFDGSSATASAIQQHLSRRPGAPLLPLLTDTGGRHAVILDHDQDLEALLPTLLRASLAFNGQHPAALRILYLEDEIAERMEALLSQALPWIRIGAPERRATDVGPLLSRERMDHCYLHIERLRSRGRLIAQTQLPEALQESYFVPPTLLRLYTLDELQETVEGPIVHLIRFSRDRFERTLDEINRSGFGMAITLYSGDAALQTQALQSAHVSELNINPKKLHPDSDECPHAGSVLSGTASRPGTAAFMKALLHYQRITGLVDGFNSTD